MVKDALSVAWIFTSSLVKHLLRIPQSKCTCVEI